MISWNYLKFIYMNMCVCVYIYMHSSLYYFILNIAVFLSKPD